MRRLLYYRVCNVIFQNFSIFNSLFKYAAYALARFGPISTIYSNISYNLQNTFEIDLLYQLTILKEQKS